MTQLSLYLVLHAAVMAGSTSMDYATAYQETTQSGRPLVVLIGADWCPGCQTMKNSVIPELQRKGGLTEVSFAYVNSDRERELAGKLMRGSSIPQLVVFNKTETGWSRQQMTGARSVTETQEFIRNSAASSATRLTSH